MSVPSSPRVPMSPDLSRRRIPRPKDKRRALRDFYGIQQNQNTGPVEFDPLLDGPNFDVQQYLRKLNEDSDIKKLLKLENQMIREIRVLDGERKALVYDNYGRMISATDTIKHVTTDMQPLNRDTFEPILKSISDLTKDINDHSQAQAQHEEFTKVDPDSLMKDWLLAGPTRARELIKNGELSVAELEIKDIEESLKLSVLEEKLQADLRSDLGVLLNDIKEAKTKKTSTTEPEMRESNTAANTS